MYCSMNCKCHNSRVNVITEPFCLLGAGFSIEMLFDARGPLTSFWKANNGIRSECRLQKRPSSDILFLIFSVLTSSVSTEWLWKLSRDSSPEYTLMKGKVQKWNKFRLLVLLFWLCQNKFLYWGRIAWNDRPHHMFHLFLFVPPNTLPRKRSIVLFLTINDSMSGR